MLDAPAYTFRNLARPLRSTNANVLGSHGSTLANIARCIHRMQRDEIDSPFPGAFRRLSDTACCAFTDVSGTAADVAAGTAALQLSGSRWLDVCLRWLA